MKIPITFRSLGVLLVGLFAFQCDPDDPGRVNVQSPIQVDSWMTTANRINLIKKQPLFELKDQKSSLTTLVIDTTVTYQEMDGFGYTLTGGSAQLINQKLTPEKRLELLQELFLTTNDGLGISYLRITIGSSDLDGSIFSYNDLNEGETDPTLQYFSLAPDQINLIPVLKQIIQLNPEIKIMGSPWSAPTWMKSNGLPKGGSLKPEYYSTYANYFVKYIQGMAAEGINIDAITIQNEPEHPGNTPSMTMTSEQQNEFIKNHLGPVFQQNNITTKIIIFDHNCDHPNYPISILNDPITKPMVNGSAFHLYVGEINALSTVHDAHPDKAIYFTEQWTSGNGDFGGDLQWHIKNLIIGAPRNWSRNVLEWNLAADENFDPHTDDGGCSTCQGAITINSITGAVKRNVSYYIIGHASRFVPPQSVRVKTNTQVLPNVAYVTPAGKKVLIVLNEQSSSIQYSISFKGLTATTTIPANSVVTYMW
jgi:glucosylceramidase